MERRRGIVWTTATLVTGTVLSAGAAGCGSGTTPAAIGTMPPAAGAPVPASTGWTFGSGERVEVATFRRAIALPGTVILDVRTAQEYAAGHLPAAVLADVQAADFPARLAALDRNTPYAVYCRSGNRSQIAVDAMRQAGFTQVVDLVGGILAWTQAGGRTTTT